MNNKFALAIALSMLNFSLPALADDVPQEIVITGQQTPPPQYSPNAPVQTPIEIPTSGGGQQYSSPEYAKQMAEAKAAAEKGRKLQMCGEKKARINTFTNTYDTCNSTAQVAFETRIENCPVAVQGDNTWGVKTKDGTTFGFSRTTAENRGAQCRTDAETIKTSAITNVCDKNFNAAKEAEGPLNQFCKDEGF